MPHMSIRIIRKLPRTSWSRVCFGPLMLHTIILEANPYIPRTSWSQPAGRRPTRSSMTAMAGSSKGASRDDDCGGNLGAVVVVIGNEIGMK